MNSNNCLIEKDFVYKCGYVFFYIGLFFLPSAFFISILFLLAAAVIGTIKNKHYLSNLWNGLFFLCGCMMVTNSVLQNILFDDQINQILNSNLSFIGLANWIPFFWFFGAFQSYQKSNLERRNIVLAIIFGTFPVLLSGFGQYFFNWLGPFETLNGLIIWFQRPIENPSGLTGLFNNQNYAGSWLNFVWPFCIALVLEKTKNLIKKSFSISFLVSIGAAAFLTYSRSAWGGILISIPIVIGSESFIWLFPLLIIIFCLLLYSALPVFSNEFQELLRQFIPEKMWIIFSKFDFNNISFDRLEIWKSALEFSFIKPLIGIGAASFPVLHEIKTGMWFGHSHNLFLEIAISYGFPVAIFISYLILFIMSLSCKLVFFQIEKENYYDRAIWGSLFFFLISQLVDAQYFDSRISMMAWLLLGCLKCIIDENKIKKNI